MNYSLGIDIGTTFSAMAIVDEDGKIRVINNSEGKTTTPSVIYFDRDNIIVGEEANELQILGEENVASYFKRNLGNPYYKLDFNGKDYNAEELTTLLVKKMKQDAESDLNEKINDVVITVPAYFNNIQRQSTIAAGKKAGFKTVEIINEPTAAVIAYGLKQKDYNKNIVVYDLGGGTFDVTLAKISNNSIDVLGSDGDHELGGKEYDDRLALYLVHKFNEEFGIWLLDNITTYKNLLIKCEKYKKELSIRDKIKVPLNYFGKKAAFEVTREEFEILSKDLLERTIALTKKVINDANLNLQDIDEVLLIGGSTRMPMVKEALFKIFNKLPMHKVNVEEAVATGAAIEGYNRNLTGFTLPRGKKINDIISHSLGMIAINENGDKYTNSIIISKNSKIPCSEKRSYKVYTDKNENNFVEVYILQGESKDPMDCNILGKYVFNEIKHIENFYAIIDIIYNYDKSGLVSVKAVQRETKKELPLIIESLEKDFEWINTTPKLKAIEKNKSVLIAIDLSGSMSGQPVIEASKAAERFVEEIDLNVTSVGILAFGDKVKMIQPLSNNKVVLKDTIRELQKVDVGIGTSTQPLSYALKLLSNEKKAKYIIILTDGKWYGNNNSNVKNIAKHCKEKGIEIIALGFGDAEEKFLKSIASANENALYTTVGNLTNCFSRIAQELSKVPIGRNIKIFK